MKKGCGHVGWRDGVPVGTDAFRLLCGPRFGNRGFLFPGRPEPARETPLPKPAGRGGWRGWNHVGKTHHTVPRHHGRARRQGREVRRAARRRRSRGMRARLRGAGRGRTDVPRHHRLARGARHDRRGRPRRRPPGLHAADRRRRRPHVRRYPQDAPGRRGQGLAQHRRAPESGHHQRNVGAVRQPVHRAGHRRAAERRTGPGWTVYTARRAQPDDARRGRMGDAKASSAAPAKSC